MRERKYRAVWTVSTSGRGFMSSWVGKVLAKSITRMATPCGGGLIEAAGGTNIAKGQIAKWGPLSPEYVLAQNPEVIFLAGSGWAGRDQAVLMGPGVEPALTHSRMAPYMARPGWDGLDAVKEGNIHAIYHGGARTLYDFAFLQYIAKTLHPDLFADIDPQANLDAFFRDYMPIQFSGTYMTKMP